MIRPPRLAWLLALAGLFPAVSRGLDPPYPPVTAVASPHSKPLPGAEVSWDALGPAVPGETVTATLRVISHHPGARLRVHLAPNRAAAQVLGPLPEYDGVPPAGDAVSLAVPVRIPDRPLPPLEAILEVTGDGGTYQVRGAIDLTPASLRPVPPAGIRARALSGPVIQFGSRRSGPSPVGGRPLRALVSPGSPGKVVRVSGSFVYRDRPFGPEGFLFADNDSNPVDPVRDADVELLVDGAVADTGSTDSTGSFAFSPNLRGTETVQVRVMSRIEGLGGGSLEVRVTGSSATYAAATPETVGIAGDTDLGSFVIEPGQGGEAMNLLDRVLEGAREVALMTGSWPAYALRVYWSPTSTVGTYYSRSQDAIYLLADDGYDDSVVLHEYGHSVAYHYSRDESPGGVHYIDDADQDPRLSWSEGFASFFQSLVRLRLGDPYPSWYVDTRGTPGAGQLYFSYEAEGPGTLINASSGTPVWTDLYVRGLGSEVVVHALLWDVVDGPDTPGDPAPGVDDDALVFPPAALWAVLAGPMASAQTVTLEDFWDGWFDPSVANGSAGAMAAAFTALGVELVPDAAEDDGSPGDGAPLPLDGTPAHHTFYPAGDVDHQPLLLQSGDRVTVETLGIRGYGDTYLEILDPALAVVAANDNAVPGGIASSVTLTAAGTGAYTVRISRSSLDSRSKYVSYGAYDLRAVRRDPGDPDLADVTGTSGTGGNGYSLGAAFADYDLDGLPDLVVVNNPAAGTQAGKDALYRNTGDVTFTDATAAAGLGNPEGGYGAAWGDADNDGDPDLFLTDHALYRNEGNGTFTDVTAAAGVGDLGKETDAAWVDTDRDGDLDLFVVRRDGPSALWRNDGEWRFVDVAPQAGFDFPSDGANAYGCAWGDYDGDGWPDLFLTRRDPDSQRLYRNLGNNRFEDVTAAAGLTASAPAGGATWGDVNGDGLLDLVVASWGPNRLYLNRGDGTFVDAAPAWGVDDPAPAVGCALADADLDGRLDLFVSVQGGPGILYLNQGNATMVRTGQAAIAGDGWGCAWGDVDRDGDPDLYQAFGCTSPSQCASNRLFRNLAVEGGPRHWLEVALVGDASNRDGIGARITVRAEGSAQVREVGTGTGWGSRSRLPELFGVGDASAIDSVTVIWPSGVRDVVRAPKVNARLVVHESSGTPVRPTPTSPEVPFRAGFPAPNPFREAVGMTVTVGSPTRVRVDVIDLAGRRVRRLLDRDLGPGTHQVGWDGEDDRGREVPPGVYFYRLAGGGQTAVRKLIRMGR